MSKSYFRYERSHDGRWIPMLYTSRPPATRTEDKNDHSPIREVDAGTPLEACQAAHPAPKA